MSRRKTYKQRQGQSRSGFGLALLVVLLLLVMLIVSAGLFFKVKEVRVEGIQRLNAAEVEAVSGIQLGNNLLLINKFEISNHIFSAFPYAKKVAVTRRFPNVVVITIVESDPACTFEYAGYHWLADSDGRVLENRVAVGRTGYPLITGVTLLAPVVGQKAVFPQEQEDKSIALYPLLSALHTAGLLEQVTEIDMTQAFAITFYYADRLEVKLGFPSDFEYKLRYIATALEMLEDGKQAVLDLSAAVDEKVLLIPKD